MELIASLSSDQSYSNPLSVLLKVVHTELDSFKLAMISSHKLDPAKFQVTGFCDEYNCPVYTAEEMLNGSPNFPILDGEFIEGWKTHHSPLKISCETCPDLFQDELKYFGEALVIPIWIRGKVERWIIIVDFHSNSRRLDLEKLALLLNYALTNILKSEQKRQLDKARHWIDEELQEISRLQSLLLPREDLQINGIQLAFKFEAYKDAGGDYLDLFQLPSPGGDPNITRWGGIIADVTGHGPSAAVEAAMVDAILRTFQGSDSTTPADAANYLNKNFFTRKDRGKFVTAMLFSYRSDLGLLKYVSAGHPNGYIKRDRQVIELSESQGIPIGVLPDYQWEFKEIKLQANDILFIYTDVVLETRSLSGEEFGEQRLVSAIENSPSDPNLLVEHIQNALFEFSGRSELKDDLTLSAIRLL